MSNKQKKATTTKHST